MTLYTNTGRGFESNYVAGIDGMPRLYIRASGTTPEEATAAFSDPLETEVLRFGDQEFHGYTELVAVVPEGQQIRIVLRRPET